MLYSSVVRRKLLLLNPSKTQQRHIISYLRNVFRTGSLSVNPILESLQPPEADDDEHPVRRLPQFSLAQPHHVQAAVEFVQVQQQNFAVNLQAHVVECEKSTTVADPKQQLDDLIRMIDQVEQPAYTLRQISSLLWLLSDEKTKPEWHKAAAIVSAMETPTVPATVHKQLHNLLQSLENNDDDDRPRELAYAAKYLLRKYEVTTGKRLLHNNNNDDDDESEPARIQNYQELAEALQEVEQSLLATKSSAATSQTVANMYNYIGIRTAQAKLLGYDTVCDQVFAGGGAAAADVAEIHRLHATMAERMVPFLVQTVGIKKSKDELALDAYLADSGGSLESSSSKLSSEDSPEMQRRKDNFVMLKLEHHVTLDGALQFAFRLTQDLLGISIEPADGAETTSNASAWNADVRLFHVFDEINKHARQQYLGSFYLDPFQREGKLARSATIPIFARGPETRQEPVVCMSLEIEVPAWDTDPPVLTWEDCESLFHELGHVVQFLLAQSKAGVILGPQNMPLDISEFLPKVR
jgi:Zn-dependent oligopeptidase